MKEEIIDTAAKLLKISVEDAAKNSKQVQGYDLMYFWSPVRGGCSVIISPAGEKLAATSAVPFEKHLQAFLSGRRN